MQALSPSQLAELWNVEEADIRAEMENCRLAFFEPNGKPRILMTSAEAFASSENNVTKRTNHVGQVSSDWEFQFEAGKTFPYHWPDGVKEFYQEVYETVASIEGRRAVIKIGFCNRKAAGADRRRAVVFINGRPMVEFVGADHFNSTKSMVSMIKGRDRTQIQDEDGLPKEYTSLKVVRFNEFVTGPHASRALAIEARADDLRTMGRHAIIRAIFRGVL